MLHFIINPNAGGGAAKRAREIIAPLLRTVPHDFHETQHKSHASEIAASLTAEPGEYDIIAVGGDGTLSEVLNGLSDPARVRLGLIPCGSGNDFAAAAHLPSDPQQALAVILKCDAKYTDYMECGGLRGINAIGTGIDVDVLRRYARMKLLKGSAAYLVALIMTVIAYKPRCFDDVTGLSPVPHRAFIACAGNGTRFGGGIPICPGAVIDDGLLDVVIVDGIGKPAIPGAFLKLMKGRIGDIQTAHIRKQPSLKIRSGQPMPVQIDGEIHDDLPFDVRVVHGVLRFYRP